jgi:hypothetical protein
MRFTQFRDQASSESIFGQGRLESVFVLKLFALLRGEIGFQENFTRIILLPYKRGDSQEKTEDKRSHTGALHTNAKRNARPAGGRVFFHWQRELLERSRKVESFVCKKRFEF